MARRTNPTTLLIIVFTLILLSMACFAIWQVLNNRPGEEVVAPTQAVPALPPSGQLPEYAQPFNIDNTEVIVVVRPENELRTLAERPIEQPSQPETAPTTEPQVTVIYEQVVVTATPDPNITLPSNPVGDQIVTVPYEVKAGDTLFGIAEALNSTVVLMAEYGIAADDLIPGAVIQVPVVNSQGCGGYRISHLVQEGDNIFRLGLNYGVTEDAIRQANGIIGDLIYTGDILCIP